MIKCDHPLLTFVAQTVAAFHYSCKTCDKVLDLQTVDAALPAPGDCKHLRLRWVTQTTDWNAYRCRELNCQKFLKEYRTDTPGGIKGKTEGTK